jgi:type IV secretory pathway TraG/TraD family ATPase VirD4
MTPGEVGQLPIDEALLVISANRPFRVKKVPWFTDPIFQHRIQPVQEARP